MIVKLGGKIRTFLFDAQLFAHLLAFYLDSPNTPFSTDCKTDSKILKSSAVQNDATAKPPTISEHNKMITALITNKKSPNVSTVTGRVNNTINGLINRFNSPSTIATMIEVPKPATSTPPRKLARNSTIKAVTTILISKFIRKI